MEALVEKRSRSPNYPAISLPAAIEKVATLYKSLHTHSAPREVIAKGLGYQSLSGASATAISSLVKYGLLDRMGEELKVSERALRILHPHTQEEKTAAIKEASREPALFNELLERFNETMPNEELLRNYLTRKAFVPAAVSMIVLAFRETLELVRQATTSYDSPHEIILESTPMNVAPSITRSLSNIAQSPLISTDERPIGRYDFEDGSYVRIAAAGDLDTETALEMVETLVKLKRSEIAKRKSREAQGQSSDNGTVKE
jgi:hypothetical protein